MEPIVDDLVKALNTTRDDFYMAVEKLNTRDCQFYVHVILAVTDYDRFIDLMQEYKHMNGHPNSRKLVGKAWYKMLNDDEYKLKFAYVSPQVKRRNEFIRDGDAVEGNDWKQSDVVQVLLHWGYLRPALKEKDEIIEMRD